METLQPGVYVVDRDLVTRVVNTGSSTDNAGAVFTLSVEPGQTYVNIFINTQADLFGCHAVMQGRRTLNLREARPIQRLGRY
jgi:hypothetical protein